MYRIYIYFASNKYKIAMTENSKQEIPENGSFNNSIFLFNPQQKTQIIDSSISMGLQQSYEQQVSEKHEEVEQSNNPLQELKQSTPFSIVMSTISQKDQSINQTMSIHKYNAQLQEEEDFLPSIIPELLRIKELEDEVKALKSENQELKKKVGKAGAQNGVSFDSFNDQTEEEKGPTQSNHAEMIDYKLKYQQYKNKCKFLMKRIAAFQAIMSKPK